MVIVVDALDEAQTTTDGSNRLYLPKKLAKGIYFVVTTQPLVKKPLLVYCAKKDFPLRYDSEENLTDIRNYILLVINRGILLERIQSRGHKLQEFVQTVQTKSEGNFMYLYFVLPELERDDLEIDELPQGLQAYYERHWQKMKSRDFGAWVKYQQPVIQVLAALPEFITINDIAEFIPGLTPSEVASVIVDWRPFLRLRIERAENRYRLYHLTFQEFLKKRKRLEK